MKNTQELDYSECVYNLLNKTVDNVCLEEPKKPRFKSVYSDKVKEEMRKNKEACRTMGENNSLKKNEISSRSGKAMKELLSINTCSTNLAAGKSGMKQEDAFKVTSSGLQPLYVNKKEYGKVPAYLEQRKKEVKDEQKEYDDYVDDNVQHGKMKQVAEEEKKATLQGLKNNRDALVSIYQKMSLTIDTVGKKRKKAQLEAEMKQLDKDISLLEGYPTIYLLK